MSINANALDTLGIRAEWAPRILGGERGRPAETRMPDGRGAPRTDPARLAGAGSFGWQLSGDKAVLENLHRLWGRPVHLKTVVGGKETLLSAGA